MPTAFETISALGDELKIVSELLRENEQSGKENNRGGKALSSIIQIHEKIRGIIEEIDPVKLPEYMFDPSNPQVVGRIVGITMIAQRRIPLDQIDRFYGSGVYAIYYCGDNPAYSSLSRREHPIYVGKADPSDPSAKTPILQGERLSRRLKEHRKSIIRAKTTLKIEDFEYRTLVVQSGIQTSAENYLIELFKPVWNNEMKICYGFGKHGDDPGTRKNLRSPWDTLHPGRDWAYRDSSMKDAKSKDEIIADIRKHLEVNKPLGSIDEILKRFLDEMKILS